MTIFFHVLMKETLKTTQSFAVQTRKIMSIRFPLVSPIPISTVGENAGLALVSLVSGATPIYDANAKTITITMTISTPTVFALVSNSAHTVIKYTDGVCTVSGPPAFVIPTLISGIQFRYDIHKDVSKEKISVFIHDGKTVTSQTLVFEEHKSSLHASISAAKLTTFIIGVASPLPNVLLSDLNGEDSHASVTIIPDVPSALSSIGTTDASGTDVHVNAANHAGRAEQINQKKVQGTFAVKDNNVLSMCFEGPVSKVNQALAKFNFVAPQAIGSNTAVNFTIVIADAQSPIMSRQITLSGLPAPAKPATEAAVPKDMSTFPIFGTNLRSSTPPAPVNGIPYSIQILDGTPTWVPAKAQTLVVPVNTTVTNTQNSVPFMSSIFNDQTDVATVVAPPLAPAAAEVTTSSMSTPDYVLYVLILIISSALFTFLGWIMLKEWKESERAI